MQDKINKIDNVTEIGMIKLNKQTIKKEYN